MLSINVSILVRHLILLNIFLKMGHLRAVFFWSKIEWIKLNHGNIMAKTKSRPLKINFTLHALSSEFIGLSLFVIFYKFLLIFILLNNGLSLTWVMFFNFSDLTNQFSLEQRNFYIERKTKLIFWSFHQELFNFYRWTFLKLGKKICMSAVTQPSLLIRTDPKLFSARICKKLWENFLKIFIFFRYNNFLYLSTKKSEICNFCAIKCDWNGLTS